MEKPILFNTEMVQDILEGRKTVTRRVIKNFNQCEHKTIYLDGKSNKETKWINDNGYWYCGICGNGINFNGKHYIKQPYEVGDILYVRETWITIDNFENYADVEMDEDIKYLYKCDDNGKEHVFVDIGVKRWKPSIHMPRDAARIFLEVMGVRVERLQDITEEQIKNEGVSYDKEVYEMHCNIKNARETYLKGCFRDLWDSTIKKEHLDMYSFYANPWVWVIEFKVKEVKN